MAHIQANNDGFEEMMQALEGSAMGKQAWRHYYRLKKHWEPILSERMFEEDDPMGEAERNKLAAAVDDQIVENFDLLRYMCWETTSASILAASKLPTKIGGFATEVLGRKDTTAIRGWRVRYPWLKQYLAMCSKTGKEILNAVQDESFVEIHENAMDRENDKQVQWMKLETDIRGDKAPEVVEVDWRETLPNKRNADS